MINQDVVNYIKNRLAQGVGDDEIKNELVASGWQEGDINEAFTTARPIVPEQNPVVSEPFGEDDTETTLENKKDVAESSLPAKEKSKKHSRAIGLVVIVTIGLLVAAGGAAGYFAGHFDFLKKDSLTAEEILVKAVNAQAGVYSARSTLNTEIKLPPFDDLFLPEEFVGENAGGMNLLKIDVDAGFELDPAHFKFKKLRYVLDIGLESPETNQRIGAGVEFRIVDDANYVQLTHLPVFIPKSISDSLTKSWVKIDEELIKEEIAVLGVDLEDVDRANRTMMAKTMEALSSRNIFNVLERLEDDKIGDDDAYKIYYDINVENLAQALLVSIEAAMEEFAEEFSSVEKKEIEELKQEFIENFGALESIKGELWIEQKTFFLKRLTTASVTNVEDLFSEFDFDNEPATIEVVADLVLSAHNEPVQIEAPEEYLTVEELMEMTG